MNARFVSVLAGLFLLFASVDAYADCAQVYLAADVSGGQAYAQANIEFLTEGSGGPYPCYYYVEIGYASYVASAGVSTPNGPSDSQYMRNDWYANAEARVSTSGTGPGTAYAQSLAVEYLVDPSYGHWGTGYGPLNSSAWIEGPPGGGGGETLTLTASNSSPVQNSGSVTVTAHYSGGDVGPVTFSTNCTQASNMVCNFNPTTIGQHIVTGTLNGLQAEVAINVQPPGGSLRLFLDVDGLDPANPSGTDDAASFVPTLENFSPRQVTLVAAFVGQNGQIVPPPQGVTQATINLSQTTGYLGYAMNRSWGDGSRDAALDYGLIDQGARLQTATVSFASNQARVPLWVHDYGGTTKARATAGNAETDLLGLPTSVPGGGDNDVSLAGNQNNGDGLSDFEEWRGFIINGVFWRLNPTIKDLFMYHVDPSLASYYAGFTDRLGINVWVLTLGETDGDSWINFNSWNFGSGAQETPGHMGQKAVRIEEGGFRLDAYGEWNPIDSVPANGYPRNVAWVRVYSETVREYSPNRNNRTDEDPYDATKFRQTIAHEMVTPCPLGITIF